MNMSAVHKHDSERMVVPICVCSVLLYSKSHYCNNFYVGKQKRSKREKQYHNLRTSFILISHSFHLLSTLVLLFAPFILLAFQSRGIRFFIWNILWVDLICSLLFSWSPALVCKCMCIYYE